MLVGLSQVYICSHIWESLADAYLIRGAHTSALKSYQRALQLTPESLYPLIQLANIKVVKKSKKFTNIKLSNAV